MTLWNFSVFFNHIFWIRRHSSDGEIGTFVPVFLRSFYHFCWSVEFGFWLCIGGMGFLGRHVIGIGAVFRHDAEDDWMNRENGMTGKHWINGGAGILGYWDEGGAVGLWACRL